MNHVAAQTRAPKRAAEMRFLNVPRILNVPKIGDFYDSLLENGKWCGYAHLLAYIPVCLATFPAHIPVWLSTLPRLHPIVANHTSQPTSVAGHAFSQCG